MAPRLVWNRGEGRHCKNWRLHRSKVRRQSVQEKETRDRELETLLGRGLRQTTASEPCPEPEILAAFVERNLSKPEAHRLEHHLAACGRCQAQMVVMVRSFEPAEPSPKVAGDQWLLNWRWLAPLAAAAMVVLAVWVVDPEPVRESSKPRNSLTPTVAPVPGPGTGTPAVPVPSPPDPGRLRPGYPTPLATSPESPGREAVATEESRTAAGRPEANRAAEAAPSAAAALASRRSGVVGGIAGGVAGGVLADQVGLDFTIRTPNPSVQWRIRRPAIIKRSTDGGASWDVQVAEAPSELLAGSAVSDVVCWVVGRGGVVMRTADGMRWERVTTPTATDLVAVVASDATSTIVTTATGERYQTNDGGRTWTEIRR